MAADRAIFQDEQGRGWLVEIEYGHPAPAERGIFAARFLCPEDPSEPVRVGYVYQAMLEGGHEEALREALEESEPARSIG
jgi:hypothetical protein